eukprot:gb/GECH01011423.1/.p1 GENE.gb/GECH01011423.1/~~gb/GECH01011423.1/.p1  ORF type:complete len:270 (+),score=64.42 gb/GECH01011423.1/:1-810(+)
MLARTAPRRPVPVSIRPTVTSMRNGSRNIHINFKGLTVQDATTSNMTFNTRTLRFYTDQPQYDSRENRNEEEEEENELEEVEEETGVIPEDNTPEHLETQQYSEDMADYPTFENIFDGKPEVTPGINVKELSNLRTAREYYPYGSILIYIFPESFPLLFSIIAALLLIFFGIGASLFSDPEINLTQSLDVTANAFAPQGYHDDQQTRRHIVNFDKLMPFAGVGWHGNPANVRAEKYAKEQREKHMADYFDMDEVRYAAEYYRAEDRGLI